MNGRRWPTAATGCRSTSSRSSAGLSRDRVPEALYEPLFARLRASANVVPVVEAAAVIGRQMDRGLLCSVVDLSDDEVDDVIDELEDALVLEPWGTELAVSPRVAARGRRRAGAPERAPRAARQGRRRPGRRGGEPDWQLVAAHYERAERFDEAASAYQQASTDARRRGALAEARTYLTQALAQLDRATPGPDRDRREMAVRLERGFLAMAAEGQQSRARRRRLRAVPAAGRDRPARRRAVRDADRLAGYYFARADLRRTAQVLESLRAGLEQGRQWFRPVIEVLFGVVAWSARRVRCRRLPSRGGHGGPGRSRPATRSTRCGSCPPTRSRSAHIHLALARLVRGDLTGAEAAAGPARHAGPTSSASPRARSATPTRASWRAGCASKPASSTAPRSSPPIDRAGRAARLRPSGGWRGHPAGHRRRAGRTRRRRPRPDRAVGPHRDHDHVCRHLAHGRAEYLHHLL